MSRLETPMKTPRQRVQGLASVPDKKQKLFDTSIIGDSQAAMDFITNILESSTEYSVIAKDLTGKILLWNEGARRLYGYAGGCGSGIAQKNPGGCAHPWQIRRHNCAETQKWRT